VRQSDLVISLVTPFGAAPLAQGVAEAMRRSGARPTYIEGNSISPTTAKEIADTISAAGGEMVDGGIIGSASNLDKATFYFSGPGASRVAALIEPAVATAIVGPEIGQASGLKILNAGLSKGLSALGVELLLCADRLGLVPHIMARYRKGRSGVADFFEHTLPGLPPRAARRSEEMQELTDLMEELGLTAHTSRAAQQVLMMVAERYAGAGSPDWERLARELAGEGALVDG